MCFIFIYCLFNYAVISIGYVASNDGGGRRKGIGTDVKPGGYGMI
jgi:hypothetical protein